MLITLSIFQTFLNIIIFLLVLSIVINIHELGHLFFAKRAGILCHEFSFGMGPRLWSKKVGETVYSIRAIPFGGYVSMAGEEIESEIIKDGQKIRLGFDINGEVTRIVLKSSDPNYHDFHEIKVETFDLTSPEGTRLFINEYTVNRKAMYMMDKKQRQITPR
nr:site-2 protease family protein [Bacillota bacterium]